MTLSDYEYYRDSAGVIYCADCLEILPLLEPNSVDLVVTSPPYNVGMEYEIIRPWPEYYSDLKRFAFGAFYVLKDGGVLSAILPKDVKLKKDQIDRQGSRVERIAARFEMLCQDEIGYLPRESIVWAKSNNEGEALSYTYAMGSDNNIYIRPTCEIVTLNSKNRYYYDGGTGRRGSKDVPFLDETKDLWWIAPVRSRHHPCPYPEIIADRLIRMFTLNHKFIPVVLDPYMGIGTTAVAAKQLGRKFIGIEIEEKYCEIAKQRLAQEMLL